MDGNIRIAVLSTYDKVCAFLDNNAPDAMHYYSDELHTYLNGAANTYAFTTSARHKDSTYLTEGNKLAFTYRSKDYYLNIMKVTRTEYEVEIEAYSLNFELLNEQKEEYKAASAMSFAQYLDVFDFEKVVTLGINEVSDKRITNEWTGTETMLARIFSLANVFSAEVEFIPELNEDYSLKRIVMNVYREHSDTTQGVGTNRTDITLRYGTNVSGITKTSDITGLYTAIRPIGRDGLTVSSLNKTELDAEGRVEYQSPAGKRNIYAVQARDRFPSNLMANENERYIAQVWDYDTDNVNTLYGQALAELKKSCVPQVSYEVDGYFDTDIGDTVSIADEEYNPPLYLQARVTEQQRSFTNPTQNKTTFSNYKEMQSQIDPALLQKMNDLIDANKAYTCSILSNNGIVFKNGEGSTTLTASVMDVGKDMTDKLTIRWFVDKAELVEGKSITVNAESISGKAVYRFEATDSAGNLRGSSEVTVANVNDGANGKPGENGKPGADAYTLYLSTSSSVFNADFDGNLAKNISVSTAVVAFKGATQLTPVIGTLPDVSGFALSLSGSTITITGKKGGDMADNGTINIPVTVDGIACTLTFTYAKVKDGYHGEDAKLCTVTGNQIMKYASGSTTPVPESLILTAAYQNTNHSRWQHLNEFGIWADFIPSETKTSITITADSTAWLGNTATIRAVDTTGTAMDTATLAKLRDGEQGIPGKPGADVTAVDVEYYLSTSATSLEGGTWQTAAPTWVEGKYIWTRTKTTLSDGKETVTDPVCITGSKGQTGGAGTGVQSITEEYYLSNSKTEQTGGSWSEKPPSWSSGKYVWTRSKILYKNPTSTAYTVPVCDSSWEAVNEVQIGGRNLIVGSSDATVGPQWSMSGWSGTFNTFSAKERTYKLYALNGWRSANYRLSEEYNGKQVTVSLMAKLDSAGTTSTDKNYLFVNTPTTTTNLNMAVFLKDDNTPLGNLPEKDKWIRLHVTTTIKNTFTVGIGTINQPERQGMETTWFIKDLKIETGNKATDWTPAPEDIQEQINGTIINVDVEYYLSASATDLTGGTWQSAAPAWAEGKYIWTRTKKTYADSSTEYTDPTCITGATGKGIKGIEEQYYLSTSATSLSGGSWQTTAPAWVDGKYVWTRSVITYTDKSTETTSPVCVSGGKGNTGATGTGYTVLLSNESYTFAAGTSAALAGSTDTGVTAYKNTTQIAATVTKIGSTAVTGNASGVATGFAGLTAAVTGNGTTGCKVTFAAATTLTTKNGSVPISVTVDGRTFVKDFSFSLALKGDTGSAGDKGDPTGVVESATEPSMKYVGMLWKNTGESGSYIKESIYRWTGAAWELFQFSAQNINAKTFTGYEFNGAYINGGKIKGKSSIEIQRVLTRGSYAGDTVWVLIDDDGISVRQFSPTTVLRGEVSITPFDVRVLSASRTFQGVNYELNKLNNKFTSGRTGLIAINGGSYTDTRVDFGRDLGSTPQVFLTFYAASQNVKYLGLGYFDDTPTGMTIRVSNSGGAKYSVYVNWMAVL